jgi:O-methyltransferase
MRNYIKQFSSKASARKEARWNIFDAWAKRSGFKLYRPNLAWLEDPAFAAAQRQWGSIPGMPEDRRYFMFNLMSRQKKVPGDTADIGVRFGSSSFFILSGLNDPARPHHVFDSFEGLSEPTAEDSAGGQKTQWTKGKLAVDESVTRKNLSMFQNVHYYKGWIPDRYPDVADRRFSLIHIDVDLYQPTKDSLEFFYDRVNPGGVIISDDYGVASCVGARKAVDEFFAGKPETVVNIPTGQCLIVKR